LANKLGVNVKAANTRVGILRDLFGPLGLEPGGRWQIFNPGGK